MPEPREAPSLLEAAEQAAAAGDYAAAEGLLREAATRQEETLGPRHPDLINTLNNLGVVCEMTDNPIDAEHYFRRAHTIATATLPPDHPFVETSRKNLHDFCAARGRPVELPPSAPQVAAWLEAPAPPHLPEAPAPPAARLHESAAPATVIAQPQELAPAKQSLNWLALGALGGLALVIVVLAMVRPWGTADEAGSQTSTAVSPAPEKTATSPTPPPPEPVAQPQPTATPAPVPAPAPAPTKTDAAPATPAGRSTPAGTLTVVTAKLCTALQTWRCEPAASQASPGPMIYYTQIKSPTATTVEHRWYQGDRLIPAVPLRIQANPGAGYRTYSRHSVSREPAGEWRVELRSADGTLLDEERITVK